MSEATIWPVILSGGSGTRLWPLSRTALPKQLLPLAGTRTMLQETAMRWAGGQPPLVVCGMRHAAPIALQLAESGISSGALIVEPAARNTAPAVALAAIHVDSVDPDGLLLVMPSDHVVTNSAAFAAAVTRAVPVAALGWLMTFGIEPTAPETGYGYIEAGAPLAEGVRAARRFVEKPSRDSAEAMIAAGGFTWNAGIFLFRARTLIDALQSHAPEVLAAARAAMASARYHDGAIHPDAAAFAAAPSISIDYAVMEKAARVAVVAVDMGWSDIGGWDALRELGPANEDGNVFGGSGRVETLDTRDCLLRAEGTTLAAIGVSGVNIIATPDAVLVTACGRAQDVREVTGRLAGDPLLERAVIATHAWGVERLVADDGVRVRRIDLLAGMTWQPPGPVRLMLLNGSAECDAKPLVPGEFSHGTLVSTGTGAALLVIG